MTASRISCKPPAVPKNIFRPSWVTRFSEIEPILKTGDIILVHGRYPFSWVVEWLQGSEYGHAAMVVLRKDIDPDNNHHLPDELLLWESNKEMLESQVENCWGPPALRVVKEGPMLISLKKRLQYNQTHYDDVYVSYRPLMLPASLSIDFKTILPAYFNSVINKGFPKDEEIIHSVYLGRKYNRSSTNPLADIKLNKIYNPATQQLRVVNEIFLNEHNFHGIAEGIDSGWSKIYCTELLAATYKELGLLTNNHVSNAYAPVDFSMEGSVRLLKRAWLDNEMFVDMCK